MSEDGISTGRNM